VKTTTVLTTLHELADIPHLPIATFPVDRNNQILLTSQSPDERDHIRAPAYMPIPVLDT
jgi:hypothetical protein